MLLRQGLSCSGHVLSLRGTAPLLLKQGISLGTRTVSILHAKDLLSLRDALTSPPWQDPQPDFSSWETEAQNSTPGSYADSVAEQGVQTRFLACWACALATIHLPAQGPFCVQSVPQTIEVFELLLILVSLKVEAGKEAPS